jgi:hypothetical protein
MKQLELKKVKENGVPARIVRESSSRVRTGKYAGRLLISEVIVEFPLIQDEQKAISLNNAGESEINASIT